MRKFRDLTLIDLDKDKYLIVACDSSGAIGEKSQDVVKASPMIVGMLTAQVALMELLATGAKPISIINTLSVEMNNTGKEIIKGIKKVLEPLNLDADILVTGSTEENMITVQTSMGITVIGVVEKLKWRANPPKEDDLLILVGLPNVGEEVLKNTHEIMNIDNLLKLLDKDYIKDILPVGSKGIAYEMGVLASTNDLNFEIINENNIDLKKSAGPATCVIVATDLEGYNNLRQTISLPVNIIGKLQKNGLNN